MMQADSEITFYTMEDLNYRLAVIMKFVSGKMTDEDFAELKNPDAKHILDLDDLIALSGSRSFLSHAMQSARVRKEQIPVSASTAYVPVCNCSGITPHFFPDKPESYYDRPALAEYLRNLK